MHIYEFELFEEDGFYLAFPYEFEGGTQGETLKEACENAADWLKLTAEHYAIEGIEMPEAEFGHQPLNGGKTVIVAVDAGLHTVPRVSAAEAARILRVSASRVSHMIRDGLLESFKEGHNTWVALYSVEARLAESPKAGRPRKTKSLV